MPKLYIAFHDSGVVRDIATEALEGYLPAPSKATSTLALRYALQDGKAVDRFPGKTDEEVLALIASEQAAQVVAAPSQKVITKLAFMNRFTMEELAAIYTAAKTEVMVEVFLDKLKIAEEVNLADAQTIGGLQALAASGLLTEARVQEVLQ
jgi:hypothetical protein